jgi:signal transduction histidine kinase
VLLATAAGMGWYFHFTGPLYAGVFAVAVLLPLLNVLYCQWIKQTGKSCGESCERPAKINIVVQIVSDFLLLSVFLHFSGGIENPAIVFYIFHVILSGIYLKPRNAYLITLLAVSLFLFMVILEYSQFIPHYSINEYINLLINNQPVYLFIALALFTLTAFAAVFIATTLSQQLRNTQRLLEESNRQLLEKDKIKDEYVQRVTHDIKGGLSVVLSSLAIVDRQILGPVTEKNAEFVKKALSRTRAMSGFVSDLLALTRMRLANQFVTQKVNVSEIIYSVVQANETFAESKKTELKADLPEEDVFINAVKVSMEEAIGNLVQNAIKYSPEGSRVEVSSRRVSDKVIIDVSDNGCGIPEKDIPHIFEEFYRAGNSRGIEGTGLGLSLVKAIVDRHKGSIAVTSNPGKGTVFSVSFSIV